MLRDFPTVALEVGFTEPTARLENKWCDDLTICRLMRTAYLPHLELRHRTCQLSRPFLNHKRGRGLHGLSPGRAQNPVEIVDCSLFLFPSLVLRILNRFHSFSSERNWHVTGEDGLHKSLEPIICAFWSWQVYVGTSSFCFTLASLASLFDRFIIDFTMIYKSKPSRLLS